MVTDADVAPPLIVALVRQGDAPADLSTLDLDSGVANDDGLLFYFSDPDWVYRFSTTGLQSGIYTITIEMADGLRYDSAFALK